MIGIYKKIELLGKGRFGESWRVENEEIKKRYVAKTLKRNCMSPLQFNKAFGLTKKVKSPYLITYIEYVNDGNSYTLIMEDCACIVIC